MAVKIDLKNARKVLVETYKTCVHVSDEIGRHIDNILNGTHLTYKYILVTELLGKASDPFIDPLSLQAKDESDGAYDARSVCHKVLVPFERDYLPGALGNSNEPFLNKPARFERLTTENAVRKGKDMATLKSLIWILSRMDSSAKARKYLSSALYTMSVNSQNIENL